MAYTKTNWVNGTTPLNDKNMNKIENELENLDTNMNKKANSSDVYNKTEIDTKINSKQDKLIAGTGIEITDKNTINNINENYSTKEVKIGKWIDGKPLYRKVYIGTLTNTPENNLISTILDTNIDEVINFGGYIKNDYNTKISILSSTKEIQLVTLEDGGTLRFDTTSTVQNWTYKIFVEYTKTTD